MDKFLIFSYCQYHIGNMGSIVLFLSLGFEIGSIPNSVGPLQVENSLQYVQAKALGGG